MPQHIDPQHPKQRSVLRIIGPAVVGIGLILTIIGMVSFFTAFGNFGTPKYFWCAFLGIPMIGIGAMICKFAYMGAISRYMANEVAPVGKDVVNYMARGTKGAVRDVAQAVGEGFRGGPNANNEVLRCHKCNTNNDASAKFCDSCGAALAKSKACPDCGELNDPDARFCDNCGKAVAEL